MSDLLQPNACLGTHLNGSLSAHDAGHTAIPKTFVRELGYVDYVDGNRTQFKIGVVVAGAPEMVTGINVQYEIKGKAYKPKLPESPACCVNQVKSRCVHTELDFDVCREENTLHCWSD